MAASREWTEWHLTPSGWVAGNTKLDGPYRERPTPADRVKTCEYREELSSIYSTNERTVRLLWEGDSEQAAALEAMYGPCPEEIEP